jgi:hypothetical protein
MGMIDDTDWVQHAAAFKALLGFRHHGLQLNEPIIELVMTFKRSDIITHGSCCLVIMSSDQQRASVTKLATKVGEISDGQVGRISDSLAFSLGPGIDGSFHLRT